MQKLGRTRPRTGIPSTSTVVQFFGLGTTQAPGWKRPVQKALQ